MDLYLPAFPSMMNELATTATGVQLSLTAFLVGAGAGHLLFGPLSDRVGRRWPLLLGTAIYVLASAATSFAPTVPLLVGARLLQGVSGAAGMVIGRAVIADLARGREAARAFSLMMLVGGVAPVVAPLAGSLLSGTIGWRGLLWIVTGLGVVSLIASALFVPETRPSVGRIAGPRPTQGSGSLLRRGFVGNALAFAFGFGTLIAYISASPFLYQNLMGLSEWQYGVVFGLNALVLTVVGGYSARLARRRAPGGLARIGLLINLAGSAAIAVLALLGVPPLWLTIPILVAVGSLGLVLGNTTALALDHVRDISGVGSAVLGLLQFGIAGVVAPLVGLGGAATAVPLALTMVTAAGIANLSLLAARRPHYLPAADVAPPPSQLENPSPTLS